MIIVTWWLINNESPLIILAYDPAAISIPSFGVNDIWSLLFKFAWVVRIFDDVMMTSSSTTKSRLSRDFSGACFESHSESNKLLQNNDRNITSVFRITWHKITCHMIKTVTWWRHQRFSSRDTLWSHMIFRFILFWNVQIGRNSLVTSAYTCGGLQIRVQHFFRMCCSLIWNPLYFCASEFRSKAIWPTADNRLKLLNESAPSGGNHICAILSSPSESLDSATKWPNQKYCILIGRIYNFKFSGWN